MVNFVLTKFKLIASISQGDAKIHRAYDVYVNDVLVLGQISNNILGTSNIDTMIDAEWGDVMRIAVDNRGYVTWFEPITISLQYDGKTLGSFSCEISKKIFLPPKYIYYNWSVPPNPQEGIITIPNEIEVFPPEPEPTPEPTPNQTGSIDSKKVIAVGAIATALIGGIAYVATRKK